MNSCARGRQQLSHRSGPTQSRSRNHMEEWRWIKNVFLVTVKTLNHLDQCYALMKRRRLLDDCEMHLSWAVD